MEMIHKVAPPILILVVEEDDLSRDILATIIAKRFPQTVVYSASTCEAGLDLMKTRPPDIIISDNVIPGMDGAPMADSIPAVKPHTKLIVITADSEGQIREGVGLSGITVDHYLFKPVSCPNLFAALEKCIATLPGGSV